MIQQSRPDPVSAVRVVALLTVRNEALYLDRCLQHLYEQGVETCLIDNGSTDESLAIAEAWQDRGVFRIERLAYPGYFDLQGILENEQRLAEEIDADWFMHYDADEIREAPESGVSLQSAITEIDRQGYNAINFDEFVFLPCHDDASFEQTDYVQTMRYYYFFEPQPLRQVKGWKKGVALDLAHAGGHRVSSGELHIAPDRFVMRHYIALSAAYAAEKYTKKRIYSAEEVEQKGWHGTRATFSAGDLVLPDRQQLKCIDAGWDRSEPWKMHAFLGNGLMPAPFIVGVGRSGTTLLRLMLDAHPELAMPPETHFLPKLFDQQEAISSAEDPVHAFLDALKKNHTWPDLNLDEDSLNRAIEQLPLFDLAEALRLIYQQYAVKHGKKRWGDKTPLYQLHMRKIAGHLPEAHFIHIIRDGRDVALSGRDLWFGPGKTLEAQANNWLERIMETRRQAKNIPYYMEVRYEELIQNTEQVLHKICDFISVDYDPAMLDYHRRSGKRLRELGDRKDVDGSIRVKSSQRRGIHKLTRKKPDISRVGRWKKEMTEQERACFEAVAGSLLQDLGYEV